MLEVWYQKYYLIGKIIETLTVSKYVLFSLDMDHPPPPPDPTRDHPTPLKIIVMANIFNKNQCRWIDIKCLKVVLQSWGESIATPITGGIQHLL